MTQILVPRDKNGVPIMAWDDVNNLLKTMLYLWDPVSLGPVLATSIPGTGAMATGGAALTTRVDDQTDASYIYIGKAEVGSDESEAVWQIQRLPKSGIIAGLYADGDQKFDNIWTNRRSLTYS